LNFSGDRWVYVAGIGSSEIVEAKGGTLLRRLESKAGRQVGAIALMVLLLAAVSGALARSLAGEPARAYGNPPAVALSGTMTKQETLGFTRPRYLLEVGAVAEAAPDEELAPTAAVPQPRRPTPIAEIELRVSVDGKAALTAQKRCFAQICSLSRTFLLDSGTYAPGQHTVLVEVLDGLGNRTTESLTVRIERDTTPPAVALSGDLTEAPGGWVEQLERGYSFNAAATDAGYGVTTVKILIDGEPVVTHSAACLEGACDLSASKSVNATPYSGGTHTVVVEAIDGAGNVATKNLTFKVDPDGEISPEEAVRLLEVLDPEAIGPTAEGVVAGEVIDPALEPAGGQLELSGTTANGIVSTEVGGGFTLSGVPAEQEPVGSKTPITAAPVSVGPEAAAAENVDGYAAVFANAHEDTDLVVRPFADGVETIVVIRDPEAAMPVSWEVSSPVPTAVEPTENGGVQVITDHPIIDPVTNEAIVDGEVLATISPPRAVDAVGNEVPVEVDASGHIIAVSVRPTADTTYPIVVMPVWSSITAAMSRPQTEEAAAFGPTSLSSPTDACQVRGFEPDNGAQRHIIFGVGVNKCLLGVGITYQDLNACLEVIRVGNNGKDQWVAARCENTFRPIAGEQKLVPKVECHRTDFWRMQADGKSILKGVLYGATDYSSKKALLCR